MTIPTADWVALFGHTVKTEHWAVNDSRGGDHVGGVVRRSDAPHAHHHDVGPLAGEPVTVAERVDDGHVPLDGDRHEVVGGREEHSPRR